MKMAISMLDQFFLEFHFKTSGKISYGILKNRLISITNVSGLIKISIIVSKNISQEDSDNLSRKLFQMVEKHPSLVKNEFGTFSVETYLNPIKTKDEDIIACVYEMIDILDDCHIPNCDTCPLCGRNLASDSPFYEFENYILQIHKECYDSVQNMLDTAIKTHYGDVKKQNYFTGILGAILAGLIGVLLYLFIGSGNYLACLSSFVAIYLGHFFYKKFKGKMTKARHWIIASILEVFILLGEYLLLAYIVYQSGSVSLGFALSHPFYQLESIVPVIIRICLNSLFNYGALLFVLKQQSKIPTIKKI